MIAGVNEDVTKCRFEILFHYDYISSYFCNEIHNVLYCFVYNNIVFLRDLIHEEVFGVV